MNLAYCSPTILHVLGMSQHKRPRVATVAEQNSSSSVGAQEAPAIKHFQCVALQYVGASHCCVRFGLNGLPPSPRPVSASPLSLSASASLFDQCMSLKLVIQGYSLLRTMLSLCLSLSLPLSFSLPVFPIPISSGAKVNPSHQPILTETVPWWDFTTAVAHAVAPWVFATSRGLIAWAWLTRYPHIGSALRMRCCILVCLVTTSSQALDGLFTVDTWRAATLWLGKLVAVLTWIAVFFLSITWLGVLLLVKLMAAKAWLAVLSLVKLAGSAGLALLADWTILAAGFYILAAFVSIWIVVTDELGLEAEQKVCYTFDLRHCAAA